MKTRSEIVTGHIDAGRNILPDERKPFCLIPNNFPFRAAKDKTQQSLHTLLTTDKFSFERIEDLDEQHYALYGQIRRFCSILYTAHQHLHTTYHGMRRGSLIDNATYPEFHEHWYFVGQKTAMSMATNKTARRTLDEQSMNTVAQDLRTTITLLLDENTTYEDNLLEGMHQQALACKHKIAELLLLQVAE